MTGGPARLLALLLALAALAGCSGLNGRQSRGPDIAEAARWQWQTIRAGAFTLATAAPADKKGRVLTVYIEGDGYAYKSLMEPSMDPTPVTPMSLELATRHPGSGPVAYLARPCQYVDRDSKTCPDIYWTTARYAPDVISAMSGAVDQLKANAQATEVILVGYSGGGAVATLLAERRNDVAGLVTVAANLDLNEWTRIKHLLPLDGSLDPASDTSGLATTRQVHFYGTKDETVPAAVTQSFMVKLPMQSIAGQSIAGQPVATSIAVTDQTHQCCWADKWHELATRPEVTAIDGWMSGE